MTLDSSDLAVENPVGNSVDDRAKTVPLEGKLGDGDDNLARQTSSSTNAGKTFSRKKLLILLLFGFILLLVGGYLWWLSTYGGSSTFTGTENIQIKAAQSAPDGIDPKTTFIVTSSESLNAENFAKQLDITPSIDFTVSNRLGSLIIEPKNQLLPNTAYAFALRSSPTTSDIYSTWAFQTQGAFRLVGSLPSNRSNAVPLNTSIELTFSSDLYEDPGPFVTFNPPLDGKWQRFGQTAVFLPSNQLQPGSRYSLSISAELGNTETDNRLGNDLTIEFETEAARTTYPELGPKYELLEVSPDQSVVIPVDGYAQTPSPVVVQVYKYSAADDFANAWLEKYSIPSWARMARDSFRPSTDALTQVGSYELTPSKTEYGQQYLALPETLQFGWYLAYIDIRQENVLNPFVWIQSTPLAGYAAYSDTESIAWIMDKISKGPANASVSVVRGEELGSSSPEGLVRFATPKQILDQIQANADSSLTTENNTTGELLLKASTSDSAIFLPLLASASDGYYGSTPAYWGLSSSLWYGNEQFWTYAQTDKPLYKPGDTVRFWGYIRPRDSTTARPSLIGAQLGYSGSGQSAPVAQLQNDLSLSNQGTFVGSLQLPASGAGYYSLSFVSKNSDQSEGNDSAELFSIPVSVEHYRKPTYDITFEASKYGAFMNESVTAGGAITFFDGTPVANLSMLLSSSTDGERRVETNTQGEYSATFSMSPPNNQELTTEPYRVNLTVAPDVAMQGLSSEMTSVLVFPSSFITSYSSNQQADSSSVTVSFSKAKPEAITLEYPSKETYTGEAVRNLPISYRVFRVWHEKIPDAEVYDPVTKTVEMEYRYEERLDQMSEGQTTTNDQGQFTASFPTTANNSYRVVYTFSDDRGQSFEEIAQIWHATPYPSDQLTLNASVEDSESGQTQYGNIVTSLSNGIPVSFTQNGAVLTNESPGWFLLKTSQRGIRSALVSKIPSFSVPFTVADAPNLRVDGVWFDGDHFQSTAFYNWKYKETDQELTVSVTPDAASYEPGKIVNADIAVTNTEGSGVKSIVNVAVIDKALLALRDRSLNILASLYQSLPAGIFFIYESHKPLPGAQAEGGGGCFVAGTPVLMADGSSRPIEMIQTGDTILTRKSSADITPVAGTVTRTITTQGSEYLVVNGSLKVTPEHVLRINQVWRVANSLKPGDMLETLDGQAIIVESLVRKFESVPVFNLTIENYATYVAGGVYVHNDKGDRSVFKDIAFFDNVETDSDGKAKISFETPDDITTWVAQSEAVVDGELPQAGSSVAEFAVTVPLMVQAPLAGEYLAGDAPQLVLRSYGTALREDDDVQYFVESKDLGISEQLVQSGKAFEPSIFNLPELPVGTFSLSYGVKKGELVDKVTKDISVKNTWMSRPSTLEVPLSVDSRLSWPDAQGSILVTVGALQQMKVEQSLESLRHQPSNRLDALLARNLVNEWQPTSYVPINPELSLSVSTYQQYNGMSLLPYSDSDLNLSTLVAFTAPEKVDAFQLAQYFTQIQRDPKVGRFEQVQALAGLAALGQPKILTLQAHLKDNLTPRENLYLGLGALRAGDRSTARAYYAKIAPALERADSSIIFKSDDSLETQASDTWLAAALAEGIGSDDRRGLVSGAQSLLSPTALVALEEALWVEYALFTAGNSGGGITFKLGDERFSEQFVSSNQLWRRWLTKEEIQTFVVEAVDGQVGALLTSEIPVDTDSETTQGDDNLMRGYQDQGMDQSAYTFKENEIVLVRMPFSLGSTQASCWQATDWLPAGLEPLPSVAAFDQNYASQMEDAGQQMWYPFTKTSHSVSFCIGGDKYLKARNGEILYTARVVQPGTYKAEPAFIQPMNQVGVFNLSQPASVTITPN